MTHEEIRKLLGGYATNTLTEAERKSLFDAALDDQELFNALQDEEALKDLLADPVTRAQLQRVLEEPARPRVAWWNRRWAWAGVVSAVAASVLIVGVVRMNSPSKVSQQVASVDAAKSDAAKSDAPQPAVGAEKDKAAEPVAPKASSSTIERKESRPATRAAVARSDSGAAGGGGSAGFRDEKKAEVFSQAAPAPPPVASPVPKEIAQQAQIQNQNSQSPGGPSQNASQEQNSANRNFATPVLPMRDQAQARSDALSIQNRSAAMIGGLASAGSTVPLRYAVLRRDSSGTYAPLPANDGLKAGDEVKLSVTVIAPGVLTLDHVDASGAPSRLFPATGSGLPVVANTSYIIPNSPIAVKDVDEKFRLILSPQVAQAEAASETAAGGLKRSAVKAKSAPAKPLLKQSAESSMDITIGPRRTP